MSETRGETDRKVGEKKKEEKMGREGEAYMTIGLNRKMIFMFLFFSSTEETELTELNG